MHEGTFGLSVQPSRIFQAFLSLPCLTRDRRSFVCFPPIIPYYFPTPSPQPSQRTTSLSRLCALSTLLVILSSFLPSSAHLPTLLCNIGPFSSPSFSSFPTAATCALRPLQACWFRRSGVPHHIAIKHSSRRHDGHLRFFCAPYGCRSMTIAILD